MTDEQLDMAEFAYREELEAWKLVKFSWDQWTAIRQSGEVAQLTSEDDAQAYCRRQAVKALLRFAAETMGKALA